MRAQCAMVYHSYVYWLHLLMFKFHHSTRGFNPVLLEQNEIKMARSISYGVLSSHGCFHDLGGGRHVGKWYRCPLWKTGGWRARTQNTSRFSRGFQSCRRGCISWQRPFFRCSLEGILQTAAKANGWVKMAILLLTIYVQCNVLLGFCKPAALRVHAASYTLTFTALFLACYRP